MPTLTPTKPLMPNCPAPLTLPLAALARLDISQPAWLRDCLQNVQGECISLYWGIDYAHAGNWERQIYEAEAMRELLIDAWLDTLCPLPVFCLPAQGWEARN